MKIQKPNYLRKKFPKSAYLHTFWKICCENFLEDFSKKILFLKLILEKRKLILHSLVRLLLFILKNYLFYLNFRYSRNAIYSTEHWTEPTGEIAYGEVILFVWLMGVKSHILVSWLTFSSLLSFIKSLIKRSQTHS